MALRKSLTLLGLAAGLLFGTERSYAQEPAIGSTPQRVSGGVVERQPEAVDTTTVAHPQSPIFRDSLPISRVAAISLGVPGFGQLYNAQYWKIPVLYGSMGGLTYLTIDANKKFQRYKRQYDFLLQEYYALGTRQGNTFTPNVAEQERFLHTEIEPVRTRMIRYNTQRTVFFTGAALTYLYFLADGVMNYPHPTTTVKRATTLAMMFPGAGQFYNKSYWKVPIVIGTFATMGYLIDWNNRIYQRMRTAYNNPNNNEFTSNPGYAWLTPEGIKSRRDNARRNRDLCIIVTAGAYLLSVVEAHVDAHMKDFDISDDLAMRVEPTLIDLSDYYSENNFGYPGVGMALRVNF
jgi:TM2 domain-containing membrane protein YozV